MCEGHACFTNEMRKIWPTFEVKIIKLCGYYVFYSQFLLTVLVN